MFETLYSNTPNATTKTTSTVSSGGTFNTLFTSPTPQPKKVEKPKTESKPVAKPQGFTGEIIKLTKSPIIGKVLEIREEIGKYLTTETKKLSNDLKNVFTLPFQQAISQLKPKSEKDKKELESIYKSKLSLEEKANKANKILEKYGGPTEETFKSAERGAEFGMTFTKPGGAIPEMGAVEGNLKYIFKQFTGKLAGKEKVISNIVGKESNPQEVINTVIGNNLEKTPQGKEMIKVAMEAKNKGKNVILQIEAPKKPKQIEAPKEPFVRGETFEMTPKANKQKVEVMKTINNYQQALERYNKNPTPNNLKIVQNARQAMTDIENKGLVESVRPTTQVKIESKPKVVEPAIGEVKPKEIKVEPKEVSVPREQLPVASKEGVEKVSRLEARVTKSLDKTPQEIKDQLGSTFTQMNKKENIAKASKYVIENPDEAMAVLKGEKEAPKGLLKNSIYVAMENQAVGDTALARKLASLQSTRAGQELSILTEIDTNSPVKIMRDIVKVREEAFVKKYGGKKPKEVADKIVGDIKKKVKVADKYDWNNFIKNLPTC